MSEFWLLRSLPGGSVDTLVFGLPQTWRNVDGLPGLGDGALLALGWRRLAASTLSEADAAVVMPLVFAAQIARLAACRWQKEVAGKIWNGLSLDTTDRGKALLQGAMVRLQRRAPGTVTRWKIAADASEVPIDLATAEAAFDVVSDHVDALFAAELDHAAALRALRDGGDPKAVGAYDFATGWPS